MNKNYFCSINSVHVISEPTMTENTSSNQTQSDFSVIFSQLTQTNFNNVILALKEISSCLSSEMVTNLNASLLFKGINYQLQRIANSDLDSLDTTNNMSEEQSDQQFEIFQNLVLVMAKIFLNEIMIINIPIFDIKYTILLIFEIRSKTNVTERYHRIQIKLGEMLSSRRIINKKTILYLISAMVDLFKDYCMDVANNNIATFDSRITTMNNALIYFEFSLVDYLNRSKKRSQKKNENLILGTENALNTCMTTLDNFYKTISELIANQNRQYLIEAEVDVFKAVGIMFCTLIEGNPYFWSEAVETGKIKQTWSIYLIVEILRIRLSESEKKTKELEDNIKKSQDKIKKLEMLKKKMMETELNNSDK